MKTVGIIFARGGSKGLPGKNIRHLQNKPLIAWSIEQALSVNRIEKVIVSTDSDEIASISREYGADVPFLRPKELAQDETPEWLAWQHALDYLKKINGELPETMVSIPTTAPLRHVIDIENCLDEYEKNKSDIVITISDAHRSPYFNMVKINKDKSVQIVNKSDSAIDRRQDAPVVYDMATVCYVANARFVMDHNSMFEGTVKAVIVPAERAVDIDTLLDFRIAEYLLNLGELE